MQEAGTMVDPTPRPDRYADKAPDLDSVNGLIQARIDGVISRRPLLRRAAAIGIAPPVVGVMMHATSDMAFAAPSSGRSRTTNRLDQTGTTVPADAPTAPEGQAKPGGTLTAGTYSEPDTLHPFVTQTVTAGDVLTGIVESLLEYDSHQQLVPMLATAYEISGDGLTYTFDLREGVKFHSGETFSGDDVIATWKIIMNPDFGAFNQNGWDKVSDIKADGNKL